MICINKSFESNIFFSNKLKIIFISELSHGSLEISPSYKKYCLSSFLVMSCIDRSLY